LNKHAGFTKLYHVIITTVLRGSTGAGVVAENKH